ncbi:Pisatin demethylase 16 [Colletotrichum chlorophyti]|uniref:Pisatin demethylase 16 n=1 Tax=Colletotrichum chlorophyti TaxID=708187 RepID=A0A1Q8RRR0_9PEZI|nr:Pisatin demethylase 16 [Colletotrichum chlorophyti]
MGVFDLLSAFNDDSWHSCWPSTEERGPQTLLLVFPFLYAIYKGLIFLRGLYRRYFHPLSKFPGHPNACVSTTWAYREALKGYPEETFEVLHKQYKTKALRVGPNELHISDPELYKVIYKQVDSFPKYARFYKSFAASHTLFTETDPVKHKERRRLLNPVLSRAGVLKLEPLMHDKLGILDRKIKRLCHTGEIDIYNAFSTHIYFTRSYALRKACCFNMELVLTAVSVF